MIMQPQREVLADHPSGNDEALCRTYLALFWVSSASPPLCSPFDTARQSLQAWRRSKSYELTNTAICIHGQVRYLSVLSPNAYKAAEFTGCCSKTLTFENMDNSDLTSNTFRVGDHSMAQTKEANPFAEQRRNSPPLEDRKCLNALFLTDPADDMETIEHNNGRALEGSCHWLQEDTAFKDWLDGHGSQLLWIRGDPGKGKTTLAISVVRMLSEKITIQGPSSGTLLASYFCDNKDNRRNSLVALLRGLLYQVLRERPHLSSHFRAVYEREEDRLFTSPNVVQSLWRTLKAILASPGIDTVYIVVDALDELEEESIGDLLKLLNPFINPHPSSSSTGSLQSGSKSAQGSASSLKWLLTSRNVPHIAHMLRQAPGISLEANADRMQDAVSNFIDARIDELQNLKGYNNKLAAYIKDTLREKSEGTFLYVSVSCRALSQPSIGRINAKRVLSEFPRGLTPLYGRIMDQIRNIQDADLADCSARVLRALVLALRPLSVMELAVAANLPEECHDDPDVLDEYISLCGSFVTLRQGTVHLVHETVKAYLQSIQELFSRPIHEYHAQLTDSFIHSFRGSLSSRSDSEEEPDTVSRGLTLLEYPSLFWMHHARQSGSATDWNQHLTSGLLERDSPTRQAWLERYWPANHQGWEKPLDRFSRLSLACYGGIPNLVSAILDRTDAVDEADSNGYTPLIWAARNGHAHVVELLISHGASCDAQAEDSTTAVIWAAIHGQQGAVEQLISAGASVQTADNRGWTPLHHAAAHGRVEILSSLLAAGADIDAKDVSQQTALQRAVFCADLPIIKALVKEKASLDVRDKDGLSFMHLVARDGHVELLDFWLNLEGKLNGLELVDDQAWTPLMHAAWFGNHEITVRLVRKGANIEARSVDGNTPLHLATSNGHEQVVRDLLEEGANPASTCNMRETPLHQAAWAGHANICLMLLEREVDAGTKSESGLTPLHQAAANGHEEVINLLLAWGADPNLVDAAGKTPSSLAEENQHHLLAQLLRDQELAGNGPHDDSTGVVQIGGAEELDHAIAELLEVPGGGGIAQPHGKPGFTRPTKVTALIDGVTRHYFLKSGPSAEMFEGEHAAMRALHDTVPSICPYSLGHGKLANSSDSFLLTEYIDVPSDRGGGNANLSSSGLSLAQKLAKLHTTPAPAPPGHRQPMFGWPMDTYCGSTRQTNSFRASWAKFFSENRLVAVLNLIDEHHGTDPKLRSGVELVARKVVPRLLGNGHLGGRRGIMPVLVHGDLWIGNRVRGTIASLGGGIEEVVFDPSACWAHSEYELGIMRMFGGFSAGFFHEYHRLVPKAEPVWEYEDRIKLYQLYHYLNHYLIFRGGYKDDAMDIIEKLTKKYRVETEDCGLDGTRFQPQSPSSPAPGRDPQQRPGSSGRSLVSNDKMESVARSLTLLGNKGDNDCGLAEANPHMQPPAGRDRANLQHTAGSCDVTTGRMDSQYGPRRRRHCDINDEEDNSSSVCSGAEDSEDNFVQLPRRKRRRRGTAAISTRGYVWDG